MHIIKYGVAISVLFIAACNNSQSDEIYNESNTNVINGIVYDIEEKPINGIYKTYYGNGGIKMEMTAKNGLPNGEGRFYDESGNLQFSGFFTDGKFNGKFYQYFEDGNIHNELNYNDGIQTGVQILYDNNSQIIAEITYENNQALSGYVLIEGEKVPLDNDDLQDLSQNAFSELNNLVVDTKDSENIKTETEK